LDLDTQYVKEYGICSPAAAMHGWPVDPQDV
jgi:hypothetical protein